MAAIEVEVETPRTAHTFVWGSGGAGQLGLGNHEDYSVPQELDTSEVLPETIITGGCHSAGRNSLGELYVWGDNEKLQLARTRDIENVVVPTRSAATQSSRVHVIACGWSHTVLIATDHSRDGNQPCQTLLSWGAHEHHQLGRIPSTEQPAYLPFPVDLPCLLTGRRVTSVACGWKHSMLVVDDGSVFSWGSGRHGELALGSSQLTADKPMLVALQNEVGIDAVYCGWQHSVLFSSQSGCVYTCGNNRHGQLGVPKTTELSRTKPGKVLDASGQPLQVSKVAVGWHFAVCLTSVGELLSWGKGTHGQLGIGSYTTAEVPTAMHFTESVTSIACGSEHTMVVTQQGELFTCGWGEHGNLGHGDTENRSSLTKVQFFFDAGWQVVSATAGGAVSVALARPRAVPAAVMDHGYTST